MTSGKQGAVLALNLAVLSGCALGPDHQTPTTELSAGFANANQPGLSTDPAHTRWWQGFEDQELERLADLAVVGNHDLRIATARLREARALQDETAFDRYPTVTADAAYSNERQSETALQRFGRADRDCELPPYPPNGCRALHELYGEAPEAEIVGKLAMVSDLEPDD